MGFLSRAYNTARYGYKQASQTQGVISVMFGKSGSGMGVFSGRVKFKDAVEKGYGGLIWVHRCIRKNAEALASVPWKAYKPGKSANELTPWPDHPAEKLFLNPNPYMDGTELIESWYINLALAGKSYWEIVPVQGKPYHLYPIRPDWLTPIPDPVNFISGFKFDPGVGGSDSKITFKPSDILWFRFIDPLNPYDGLSPIQAAARTIDTENAAILWNKTIFDNAAVPSGVLTIPASVLERGQRDMIQEDLESQFAQENMHRPLVLWGGMDWKQMALSQQDLEWPALRKMDKLEICAVLGVPPQIVGAEEDPTYANYEIARTAHWEDTIIPLLEWVKGKINGTISPMFGDGVIMGYDLSDVPAMRTSFREKVDTGSKMFAIGVPLNEINKRLNMGMPKFEWGDVWWAPSTLTPVSSAEPPELAAGAPTGPGSPGSGQPGGGSNPDSGSGGDDAFAETDPVTGNPLSQ